jgi:hypothetical protein
LVAPKSVGDYLDRVRELSKATLPDDPVFTIINGKPAKYLYSDTVQDLLTESDLRMGPSGIPVRPIVSATPTRHSASPKASMFTFLPSKWELRSK